ncbi:unnamed protein product [Trichogramma brassicae]|uniref:Uncharacterized protein n=1 Tax=Trichogramma brassicae TaxID=86971 RepID=A0A6H5INB3_9HYME|nr:unnamed protein product [Trichogramma brassicae]
MKVKASSLSCARVARSSASRAAVTAVQAVAAASYSLTTHFAIILLCETISHRLELEQQPDAVSSPGERRLYTFVIYIYIYNSARPREKGGALRGPHKGKKIQRKDGVEARDFLKMLRERERKKMTRELLARESLARRTSCFVSKEYSKAFTKQVLIVAHLKSERSTRTLARCRHSRDCQFFTSAAAATVTVARRGKLILPRQWISSTRSRSRLLASAVIVPIKRPRDRFFRLKNCTAGQYHYMARVPIWARDNRKKGGKEARNEKTKRESAHSRKSGNSNIALYALSIIISSASWTRGGGGRLRLRT